MKIAQYIYYFIRSVWYRGFFFTCKLLYKEYTYEKKLGIDTLRIENPESMTTLSNDFQNNHHYQGASYYIMELLFTEVKKFSNNTSIIDYGCGKGRVMIMAAEHGYTLIGGIDFAKELCEKAEANIYKVSKRYPAVKFRVVQADATTYSTIDEYELFFFFNPFSAAILYKVIENIQASYLRKKRNILVLYVNPVHEYCFNHEGFETLYRLRSHKYTEAILYRYNPKI